MSDESNTVAWIQRHLTSVEFNIIPGLYTTHWRNPLPLVLCADGFTVSIQAGPTLYCTPRDASGRWTAVECGLPSAPVPLWAEYKDHDCDDDDTAAVFGYVPLAVVAAVLDEHGGPVGTIS